MAIGLRERKKQLTRQQIFEAARKLFEERGFDLVTVADVAQAADVSEVTVFNYFPTKENLFYGGMQFFEEQLLEAVRTRPRGETPIKALRRKLLESADNITTPERFESIVRAAKAMGGSPSLAARERETVERYTLKLAELLASETGASDSDVEPLAVAAALMGAHRAVVDRTRKLVLRGVHGKALAAEVKTLIRRAYARIDRGLADYDVRR